MTRRASRRTTTNDLLRTLLVAVSLAGPPATMTADEVRSDGDTTQPQPTIEAAAIGGVDARTAALLLSGQQSGDVAGAVAWIIGATDADGRSEVPFVVEVDGASLLAGRSGARIAIGLFAYLLDDTGGIADHIAQGAVVDAEPLAHLIAEQGLRIIGRTMLAPGSYTLRVMVRAQGSDRFFMARSRVVVPQPNQPGPIPLTSVFPDPGGGWVTIRQHGVGIGREIDEGASFVPAARPILVEGRPTTFFVGGGGTPAPAIDASLTDPAGRVLAEYPVEVSPGPDPASTLRRATLPAVDLPLGQYTLVFETRGDGSGGGLRQSLTVALVAADGPYTWIDRANRQASTASSIDAPGEAAAPAFRRRKARAAYIEAVTALAGGDGASAREQLMALERMASASGDLRSLRRVEDSVAGDLADADPQSLLPIALLHQQLVRRYVARHEFVLAGFARSVAADRAVQIAGQPSDRVFAAALLVNLASDQARTASGTLATSYLEEALAAEPSSRAALLALGAIFERSADSNQAVQVFERLVETHPDFAEGRLRLAVNLARSGRERAAEKEFRILLDRNGTSWVDSLAAQEYARMMIDQQRGEEAQLLLSASAARLPDDQRLRVLGAFNADTAGQSLEAVEAILHLPPAEAGTSPRVRYTEWPDLGGAASAAVLREAAEAALPDLSEALQAAEGTK